MLVVRRITALGALLAPIFVPALVGGRDATHDSLRLPRSFEARTGTVAERGGERVPMWTPGHGPRTAFYPSTAPRELLLSFDDGPDLAGTPLILQELDRRGIKAIFFVTGWRLTGRRPEDIARRDLVRKIAAHGHLVANHTMTHPDLCQKPTEQAAEIDDNTELIAQTTGVRPLLFRSPYGSFCRSLEQTLAMRELPDIGWNIDPQDWKNDDEDAVFAYLTNKVQQLQGRGIMLLHDTHSASVHALPRFLDWLARENERSVRERRDPVQMIDYRVVVPKRPMVASGLPELVGALFADAAGSVTSHLPR